MKRTAIILTCLVILSLGVIATWLASIRPWQSQVLAQGYSPGGREYCVVQTFRDLVEPYQVSFYIRDLDGVWRWNYLEHEDNGWKSARVSFHEGIVRIERNGVKFREIEVPNDQVDLSTILPGYRDRYCDSGFSVDDIFAFHNRKYEGR
jgi:hypothetical protein